LLSFSAKIDFEKTDSFRKKGSLALHDDGRRCLRSEDHITAFWIRWGSLLYSRYHRFQWCEISNRPLN